MSSHDLVLHGGPIMTLDPTSPYAEAVAVRGDRIVAVGDAESVRTVLRPGYQTLDLRGRTAMPGLCDAHIHLLWTALHASQINLEPSASLETALATIQTAAEKLPADAWVVGYGWDHSLWGGQWPTAAQLDTVTGGRPAYFTRKDLHSAWVNSAALRIAGVDADAARLTAIKRVNQGECCLKWRIVWCSATFPSRTLPPNKARFVTWSGACSNTASPAFTFQKGRIVWRRCRDCTGAASLECACCTTFR